MFRSSSGFVLFLGSWVLYVHRFFNRRLGIVGVSGWFGWWFKVVPGFVLV